MLDHRLNSIRVRDEVGRSGKRHVIERGESAEMLDAIREDEV